ncbi:DUF262 domain-containing protein [Sphingomonas sp.]|jgi:uncharacterized membrane protein|uniref:DUF262 domain-containing protein n=1 Tax=Sphingomonas sp. TaxID=28214 RepID=UPI002ED8B541
MLRDEIEDAKRAVTTDTVAITVGEIASMYAANELNILPEFQRLFRWSDDRKSNFIESILIGIPVPPAFAYENDNGTWELIDGLQRISTLLEFMGLLRDPDTGALKRSRLIRTKYLPSLDGMVWKAQNDHEPALDTALQLFFRRSRIDFQILKHPSDPKTKFDLFQRLNRGGAYANEQEVRTCSMVLANAEVTRLMREFCVTPAFGAIFRLTDEQRKVQRDLDYLVRVIVHTSSDLPRGTDVQEFLDHGILRVLAEPGAAVALETAEWTVTALHRALNADALIPPDERQEGIAPRFSLRALEGIVVGIARNRAAIEALSDSDEFIRQRVATFWQQPEVAEMSAAGLRGTVRIQRSVPFGAAWFNPNAGA